jgi:hypothetical protein
MDKDTIKAVLVNILRIKGSRNYTKGLKDIPAIVKILKETYGENKSDVELFYLGLNPDARTRCSNGNQLQFKTLDKGYGFCAGKEDCVCAREAHSNKMKQIWNERSSLERGIIFDKVKETMTGTYGFDNAAKVPEIQEKTRNTNIEKYGAPTPFESAIIQDKIKEINLENLGVEYPFQSEEIRKKGEETNLERYGVAHTMFIAQAVFKKQNNDLNPFQVDGVKLKIKETNLENLGVEYPLQSLKILTKMQDNLYEKYKRHNVMQIHIPDDVFNILTDPEKFKVLVLGKTLNEIKDILHIDIKTIGTYAKKYGFLDDMIIHQKSQIEIEIAKFLDENNIQYKKNNHSLLKNLELDFLIEEHGFALEYNSFYYHSEINGNKDKWYHWNKTALCSEKGIQLVHIFEDQWNNKKDIIKNKILRLAGKIEKGMAARKTIIKEVLWGEEIQFLEKYHIQGKTSGTEVCYGAYYNNELIGLISIGKAKKRGETDIKRFASDFKSHPGLFSKLLRHYIKNHSPEILITFADKTISKGDLYFKTGFEQVDEIGPDYYYIVNGIREHKENFRKGRIEKKFDIKIPDDQTEVETMFGLGYDRIWDSGKIKFRYIDSTFLKQETILQGV